MNEACGQGQELKPYQLVGLNFLMLLFEEKIGGGELFLYRAPALHQTHYHVAPFSYFSR